MKKYPSGFTLIELLVVIAIIGLLATFAVAQFTSARDKARIAKGQALGGQVLRSVGDDVAARWDFDDCTFADSSGNDHPGALVAGVTFSNSTPSGNGCSLQFNGSSQVIIPVPGISSQQTKSLWVFVSGGFAASQILLSEGGVNHWIEITPTAHVRVGTNQSGNYFDSLDTLEARKWHHIVTTFDGTVLKLYIDASFDSSKAVAVQAPGANVTLGAYEAGTYRLTGLLDDVRIFNRSLTSQEIRKIYADGIQSHRIALQR